MQIALPKFEFKHNFFLFISCSHKTLWTFYWPLSILTAAGQRSLTIRLALSTWPVRRARYSTSSNTCRGFVYNEN